MDTSADVVDRWSGTVRPLMCGRGKGAGLSVISFEKGSLVDYIRRFPANLVWFSTPELLEIGGVPFVISTVRPTRVDTLNYYQKVAGYHDLDVRCFDAVQTIRRSPAGFEVGTSGGPCTPRQRGRRDRLLRQPEPPRVPGEDLPHVCPLLR